MSNQSKPVQPSTLPQQIAERIIKHIDGHEKSNEAFVVSIYGEWGVGKTHCLRGIEALFNNSLPWDTQEESIAVPNNRLVIPVFFSPWMYEREDHLIIPLFKSIEAAYLALVNNNKIIDEQIDLTDPSAPENKKATIGNQLNRLSRALFGNLTKKLDIDLLSVLKTMLAVTGANAGIPVLDVLMKLIGEKAIALGLVAKTDNTVPSDGKDVANDPTSEFDSLYYNFRAQLEKILKVKIKDKWTNGVEKELRFVVMVDDLDRCLPEKSIEVLESIKLFLNVKGFSFVLAVDDDIVERGIRHRYAPYLQAGQAMTAPGKGTHSNQLPITGHEYLEKIVHMPQHLSRWDDAKCEELLRQFAVFFSQKETEQAEQFVKLVKRAVPAVPRKIIRLAEALEFQQQSLESLAGKTEHNKAFGYWNLLTATRTLIIAQLYPGIFRLLRHGSSQKFWRMLFSIERLPSGQIGFCNRLQVASSQAEAARKTANQDAQSGINQDGHSATMNAPASGESSAPNAESQYSVVQLHCWNMDELDHILKNPREARIQKDEAIKILIQWLRIDQMSNDELNVSETDKPSPNHLPEPYFNAQELYDFLQAVVIACDSRNDDGLLRLWDDSNKEKDKLVSNKEVGEQQLQAIVNHARISEYDALYRYIELPATRTTASTVENQKPNLNAQSTPTTEHDKPSLNREDKDGSIVVKEIKATQDWIKAILGSAREITIYQSEYDRRGEAADDDAFAELLRAFCSLTASERQQLCTTDWQTRVSPLLSQRQLRYLMQLVPQAPDQQRFKTNDNTVIDYHAGLQWRRIPENGGKPCQYKKINELVQNANKALQENDTKWRLPTPRELQSLVDYSRSDPAIVGGDEFFTCGRLDTYWSSPVAGDSEHAWVVSFGDGGVLHGKRGNRVHVRLVREIPRSVP